MRELPFKFADFIGHDYFEWHSQNEVGNSVFKGVCEKSF